MTQKRSYTAGSFELTLDGHPTNAYIKSIEGGQLKGNLVDEPVGSSNQRIKHLSTYEFEPFSMELGMSGSQAILQWIRASWDRSYSRRNGQVTHADFDLKEQFQHEFYEALLTEVTIPACDGSSKEPAYMKLKVMPERSVWKKADGNTRVQGTSGPKQKMWLCNAFRLTIDGVDDVKYTNKIEAFTIKQSISKHYVGAQRFASIEPTKIEFPGLSCTVALEYADGLLKWHDKYIQQGEADPSAQKSGSLEFLSTDRKTTIFRINLYEVGLSQISIPQNTANSNDIKRVKFELYVGRMDLDPGLPPGMD